MHVFLDENLPESIARDLTEHAVSSVDREGWKGTRNGTLLALVEQRFDVLVTADSGLSFQNRLFGRRLSVVVLPTNLFPILRDNPLPLLTTLTELESAERRRPCLVRVGWDGRRWRRWLDEEAGLEHELAPAPAFKRLRRSIPTL
ncbi:DUF5615 family PIN-like protein [Enterovirga aerilata]|uniref:DUF5615 family PIN-like protein n=1 Tax=Enterovirga aerilata TaxID=2730920 RepID=A0A849I9E3_9HYPH|nr:DUF5615 family PIN-like protein [Enterovirga sp. DB1703]NNM73029.1 DUF5615 family PIN-like protein [Enterovirga sp. DB1703]